MDVNLTGQIVATLTQSWYSPIITASIGIIGGLVAGMITLLGVYIPHFALTLQSIILFAVLPE